MDANKKSGRGLEESKRTEPHEHRISDLEGGRA
jgi:hypothetical protein